MCDTSAYYFSKDSNWSIVQSQSAGGPSIDETNAIDPVDLSTGEFTYSNSFMRLRGLGVDYELKLNYRSKIDREGPLGRSWDHTYDITLTENADGSVSYSD